MYGGGKKEGGLLRSRLMSLCSRRRVQKWLQEQ